MAADLQPCVSSPRLLSPPGEGPFLAVASAVPALPLAAASAQLCPERWALTTTPPPGSVCVAGGCIRNGFTNTASSLSGLWGL